MTPEEAVQEYQCTGCVNGPYPECFEQSEHKDEGLQCEKHCAGTTMAPGGRIFLGLPKGFNRLGPNDKTKIWIYESYDKSPWKYDMWNIPVWKHLDEHENTLIRGMCPRLNDTWIHIFLKNEMHIPCFEVTKDDIDSMD